MLHAHRHLAAVLAALLVAAAPAVALAKGPSSSPDVPPPDIEIPAGVACDVPVLWATPVVHARVFAYPAGPDGTEHLRFAGNYVHVITNLDSGASVTLRTGGQGDWWFHPDGSIDIEISGHGLTALMAGDIGGPGFYSFRGHLADGLDSDFVLVSHAFTGSMRDICAALRG